MKMDSRLILALDETDGAKALKVAESVSGIVDAIKINWPLVLSEGPGMITRLSEFSEVVCDFKVADIPNTVRLIVENAVSRGASGVIAIREVIGDLKILSPGVGAQGGKASDAISAGADYVIVGRAIYGSEDPRASAEAFAEDIRTVL